MTDAPQQDPHEVFTELLGNALMYGRIMPLATAIRVADEIRVTGTYADHPSHTGETL